MAGIFLDSSVIRNVEVDNVLKDDIKQNRIRFEFPDGFTELSLIEECRAINALDISNPDNFDFMYDITMQMLTGKTVFVYFLDEADEKFEIGRFHITNKFMNLKSIDVIEEYPILVNWLVEFVAGYLGKKYPRSLKSIQAKMNEKKELMKSLNKNKKEVKTSFKRE